MMPASFERWLRKKGKKPDVVQRNIHAVERFKDFLKNHCSTTLEMVTPADIDAYVETIEKQKQSSRGSLYVLMNYFAYSENSELRNHTATLREARTRKTRRIFPLKEFLDIDQDTVQKLRKIGIRNVEQMLDAGKTVDQRSELARKLDVSEESILELVKLSDLTRLGYVKAKLTRLYYNAGLDCPSKIAAFEPDELHAYFTQFVQETGWDGMVPNPGDLVGNIQNARSLDDVVRY